MPERRSLCHSERSEETRIFLGAKHFDFTEGMRSRAAHMQLLKALLSGEAAPSRRGAGEGPNSKFRASRDPPCISRRQKTARFLTCCPAARSYSALPASLERCGRSCDVRNLVGMRHEIRPSAFNSGLSGRPHDVPVAGI